MENQDESNVTMLQMHVNVQPEHTNKKEYLHDLEQWFRHAETVGQTRLNTSILTESVLLAVCGFLLDKDAERASILTALFISVVGLFFAGSCVFLGRRQVKFHRYIEHLADGVINTMPAEERNNSAFARVRDFQHGHHRATDPHSPYDVDLHRPEITFSARTFMYAEPIVFLICFMALIVAEANRLHGLHTMGPIYRWYAFTI